MNVLHPPEFTRKVIHTSETKMHVLYHTTLVVLSPAVCLPLPRGSLVTQNRKFPSVCVRMVNKGFFSYLLFRIHAC